MRQIRDEMDGAAPADAFGPFDTERGGISLLEP
jgi:hypothetical protein